MIRLLIVLVAVFFLWHIWRRLTLDGDEQARARWRRAGLYVGGGLLIALGLWLAASGRLSFAWVGLLGLLAWFRRGMFFYQLFRRAASFGDGGFGSFFRSASRASDGAGKRKRANRFFRSGGMSRRQAAQLLGVAENASKSEIARSFRAKMRRAHPDVGGDGKIAQQLNAARDVMLRG